MIFACVRTGNRYPMEYVVKLRNMVSRHGAGIFTEMVCLTDSDEMCDGVRFVNLNHLHLPKWWMKMALFNSSWRGGVPAVYADLDSVIINTLSPLSAIRLPFAISANFTRLHGNDKWPCQYGSCVMTFGAGFGDWVFEKFYHDCHVFMRDDATYGDQMAIQRLLPNAALLQSYLPEKYLVSYRSLTDKPNLHGTSIINFGGSKKPHNTPFEWVKRAWA